MKVLKFKKRRQGALAMIEFALVMPAIALFLFILVDTAFIISSRAAVQDSLYTANRVAVQIGGAGISSGSSLGSGVNQYCNNGAFCTNLYATSYSIFVQDLASPSTRFTRIPRPEFSMVPYINYFIESGAVCSPSIVGSPTGPSWAPNNQFVVTHATFNVSLLTPFFTDVLFGQQTTVPASDRQFAVSAVSKCEYYVVG